MMGSKGRLPALIYTKTGIIISKSPGGCTLGPSPQFYQNRLFTSKSSLMVMEYSEKQKYFILYCTISGGIYLGLIFCVCSPAKEQEGSALRCLTEAMAPTKGVRT